MSIRMKYEQKEKFCIVLVFVSPNLIKFHKNKYFLILFHLSKHESSEKN